MKQFFRSTSRPVVVILLAMAGCFSAQAQVGIGTTAPNGKSALDIQSSANDKGMLIPRLTQPQRRAILNPPQGLMVFQTGTATVATDSVGFWYATGAAGGSGVGKWLYLPDKSNGDNLGNHTATQNLNLADKLLVGGPAASPGSTGLSILSSGNVGIGTTTPLQKLHVMGNATLSGVLSIGNNSTAYPLSVTGNTSNTIAALLQTGSTTGTRLNLVNTSTGGTTWSLGSTGSASPDGVGKLTVGDNNGTRLTIDVAGQVGIGTTNPATLLDVNGETSTTSLSVDRVGLNSGSVLSSALRFGSSGTGEGIGSARTGGSTNQYGLDFYTGYASRLSIANSGRVGIGTTSPTALLDVNGSTRLRGLTTAGVVTTDASGNLSSQALPVDTDAQTLSISGGIITISGSNSSVTVPDASATNELQAISKTGSTVTLSNGGGSFTDTDTDAQTLSVSGSTLSISGGNSVTLPGTTGESTTAGNGLTLSGTDVKLGGALTGNTNIATAGYSLTLSGAGKLGLGLSSATYKLHVQSSTGDDYDDDYVLEDYRNSSGISQYMVQRAANGTAASPATLGDGSTTGINLGGYMFVPRISTGWGGNGISGTGLTGEYRGDGTTNLTQLSLATSGSTRMVLDPTGQVGIGTTAPTQTLDVNGPARVRSLTATGTRMVTADAGGNLGSAALPTDAQALSISGSIISLTNGGSVTVPSYTSESTIAGNGLTLSGTQVQLGGTLGAATTVAQANNMFALTGGKIGLGIGSDVSGSRVNVAAGSAAENGLFVKIFDNTSTANSLKLDHNGSNLVVRPATAGGSTTVVENTAGSLGLNPGGNSVGIGTSSPAVRLHVAGTAGTGNVRLESLGGAGVRYVTADAGGNLSTTAATSTGESTTASNGLTLNGTDVRLGGTLTSATTIANGSNTFAISGTGNVGIGTTSPSASFDVNGPARVRSLTATGTRMVTADASGNLGSTTLPVDTDAQALSISGGTISLTNGGSVTVPDISTTNELQTISKTGSTVTLSNGGGSFTDTDTDTDAQTLSLSGNTLSISSGNSVTLATGSSVTASNGLALASGDVKLGGTLTGTTTVAQAGNMFALTGGKIGLGTSTDVSGSRVSVAAGSSAENGLFVGLNGSSTANSLKLEHNGSNMVVRPAAAGGSTTVVENSAGSLSFNPSAGNVGVGTTSPSALFDVNGTARVRSLTAASTRMVTADADGNLGSTTLPTDAQALSISGMTLSLTNGGSVTIPGGSADNLGNHTATQNLNLSTYKLIGNGSTDGLAIGSNGRLHTGGYNLALGYEAGENLAANTVGSFGPVVGNVMLGMYAGSLATAGFNTLVGSLSGQQVTTGTQNTFLGYNSGFLSSTGSGNTLVGSSAGYSNQTGSNNTALGNLTNIGAALSNATAIGYGAAVTTSNSLVLGSGANVGIGLSAPTSTLHVTGSEALSYTDTGSSTSFTLGSSHRTVRRFGTCATITIPAASTCPGRLYTLINSNGQGAFTLTVTGGGSVYDDITNTTFSGTNAFPAATRLTMQSDGSGWIVVSR